MRSEYPIARGAEDDCYLVLAGGWRDDDADNWNKSAQDLMAGDGAHVSIQDVTRHWGVFVIAAPQSRAILAKLIPDVKPEPRARTSNSLGFHRAGSSRA